jgi:phage shock protein PspC (stress-responsive transcriptional regulator)/predicted membrane protein
VSSMWTMRRSATDSKLTGLCGGLARYWGVDPTLVRVGAAMLALSGGIGVVLYFAGWLLIPQDGKTQARADEIFGPQVRRWSKEVWLAIVVIASVIAFAIFGAMTPFGVGPAIVLAGIWYFGYYRNHKQTGVPPAADPPDGPDYEFINYQGPTTPFTEAAQAWRQRIEEHAQEVSTQPAIYQQEDGQSSQVASWPAPSAPAAATGPSPAELEQGRHRAFLAQPDPVGLYSPPSEASTQTPTVLRRRDTLAAKRLRLVCLIVLGLTLSGLGVANYLGAGVPLAAFFGAALLVTGITLLAAAWLGRARGLLPLGILLLVGLLATSVVQTAIQRDEWTQTLHSYAQVAELPPNGDSRDMGRLTTDLSRLNVTGDVTYRARVDLGSLTVVVPPDARVRVNYAIDSGMVQVFDTVVAAGTELHDTVEPDGTGTATPVLTLDLSVDSGKIVVRR